MNEQFQSQVFQREGDPYIYLFANQQWYCYNPNDEPLGSGAMGTVYLGFSCSTNQRVAVKRVKDQYANNSHYVCSEKAVNWIYNSVEGRS